MKKQVRLNAFAMNCVAHQSPGLWTHPLDRTSEYNRLPYWLDLARTLERGRFDGLFLADVLGVYDVFGGSPDAALRNAAQVPVNDPMLLISAILIDSTSNSLGRKSVDLFLMVACMVAMTGYPQTTPVVSIPRRVMTTMRRTSERLGVRPSHANLAGFKQ